MKKIEIETSSVDNIPILTMKAQGIERCPLVFFIHGFTADKRQGLSFGYELALKGFYFVALDTMMHGERLDPKLEAILSGTGGNVYPVGSGLDAFFLMHEIIVQTSEDIATLIEYFKHMGNLKANAIGLTGYSMGGFACFYIAANNPAIQAVIPIAGIPAFTDRWQDVVLESTTYPAWSKDMDAASTISEQQMQFMKAIDPLDKLAAFYPKPLLIMQGDLDTDSPKKYIVDLYRKLKPVYQNQPERLQLRIYDKVGHQFTPNMIEDACAWFDHYLSRWEDSVR